MISNSDYLIIIWGHMRRIICVREIQLTLDASDHSRSILLDVSSVRRINRYDSVQIQRDGD